MRANEPPRVLVVDDRVEMADLIADVLAEQGYHAIATASGKDAIRRLRDERIDALVTDVGMPEISGFDLLRVSIELDPARPVIVMTADDSLEKAVEAAGAYHYLPKPFRLAFLVHLIDQALQSP